MTEEDFLRRWSRRKREVAEAEKPAATDATAESQSAAIAGTPATAEAAFDPASLPPIDSLNALSDVTAFLRAGVPADLTRAALRRVWTADPAISEFVGLAENAWDFTDPAAIPGFGPLEMTDDVRRMIAQVIDQIGQAPKPVTPPVEERVAVENSNYSNEIEGSQRKETDAGPAEQAQQIEDANLSTEVIPQRNIENTAAQYDPAEQRKEPRQFSYRSHGGALPH